MVIHEAACNPLPVNIDIEGTRNDEKNVIVFTVLLNQRSPWGHIGKLRDFGNACGEVAVTRDNFLVPQYVNELATATVALKTLYKTQNYALYEKIGRFLLLYQCVWRQ